MLLIFYLFLRKYIYITQQKKLSTKKALWPIRRVYVRVKDLTLTTKSMTPHQNHWGSGISQKNIYITITPTWRETIGILSSVFTVPCPLQSGLLKTFCQTMKKGLLLKEHQIILIASFHKIQVTLSYSTTSPMFPPHFISWHLNSWSSPRNAASTRPFWSILALVGFYQLCGDLKAIHFRWCLTTKSLQLAPGCRRTEKHHVHEHLGCCQHSDTRWHRRWIEMIEVMLQWKEDSPAPSTSPFGSIFRDHPVEAGYTRMSPKDHPVHRVDDIHNLEIQNRIWVKSNKHPKKQMYIQDESDKLYNLPCDLNSHPFHHNTSLSRLMLSDLLLYAQKLESPGHGEEVYE